MLIEKEALATTWVCKKFSTYVLGMKFSIETDHNLWYHSFLPNSWTACLHEFFNSDSGLQDLTTASSMSLESCCTLQTRFLVHHCQKQKAMKPYRRKLNLSWQLGCPTCPQVKQGWTNIEELKLPTQSVPQQSTTAEMGGQKSSTSTLISSLSRVSVDTLPLLLYGSRIVVPKPLQKQTLQKLLQGHQGIQRSCLRASQSV